MSGENMTAGVFAVDKNGAAEHADAFGKLITGFREFAAIDAGSAVPAEAEGNRKLTSLQGEPVKLIAEKQVFNIKAQVLKILVFSGSEVRYRFNYRMGKQGQTGHEVKCRFRFGLDEQLIVFVIGVVGIVGPVVLDFDRHRALDAWNIFGRARA